MDLTIIFIGVMLVLVGAIFVGFPIGSLWGKREALKHHECQLPTVFIQKGQEVPTSDILESEYLETKEEMVITFDGLLSKDDFFKLLQAIKKDGNIDENEAEKLTKWATESLTQAHLVTLVMNGFLKIQGWDENGFPLLVPAEEEEEREKKTNET